MHGTILISVGGTAGHIYPALSLARELKSQGLEVHFIGGGLKKNPFFSRNDFLYDEISSSTLSGEDIFFPFKKILRILKGIFQSYKVIKQKKPSLIVAFGSFYTFPTLIAALCMRKSFFLHEQNIHIGKVNRLFRKRAKVFASHFPQTIPALPKRGYCTGMPLRFENQKLISQKEAKRRLELDENNLVVLVFGGSQGALFLNKIFLEALEHLKEETFSVIHLTGKNDDFEKIEREYKEWNRNVYLKPYEEEMLTCMLACDFMISRAGAASIAEQIYLEKPAILIPYPYASNHQEKNADYMEQVVKGSIKLLQNQANGLLLAKCMQNFFQEEIKKEYIANIQEYKLKTKTLSLLDLIKKRVA